MSSSEDLSWRHFKRSEQGLPEIGAGLPRSIRTVFEDKPVGKRRPFSDFLKGLEREKRLAERRTEECEERKEPGEDLVGDKLPERK